MRQRAIVLNLIVCVVAFVAAPVLAAPMYSSGAGGPYVWDNATTPVWSAASGGPYTSTFGGYNDAVFEGAGAAVTVAGVNANSMTFTADGYVLSGGTITLGSPSGGPGVTVDAGLTAVIHAPLSRAGSGQPYMTKRGDGLLVLDGAGSTAQGLAAYQGTLEIAGGSLAVANDLYVGGTTFQGVDSSLGTLLVSNGALTVNGANFLLGQTVNGTAQVSQFTQTGGTVNHTGGWLALANGGGTSQMDISGGTFTTASALNIGIRGSGEVNVSGTGVLNVNGINTGHSASGAARTTDITISDSAALHVTGGNIILANQAGASTQFTQTGGSFTFGGGGYFYMGNMGAPTQSVDITGGTFAASNTGATYLAVRGTASFTVGGDAEVSLRELGIGHGSTSGSTGIVNLDGGRLTLGRIFENSGGHHGIVNFNGGVLRASASNSAFLTGLDAANIQAGGAVIDTQNYQITVGQALLGGAGDGGLVKDGTGDLFLTAANTYTGGTTVNAGRLILQGSGNLGSGSVIVNPGGELFAATGVTLNNAFSISGDGNNGLDTQPRGALRLESNSVIGRASCRERVYHPV